MATPDSSQPTTTEQPQPERDRTRSSKHRVVIVGGGFGGLFAAKFLRRAQVQVTLVDRTNHHLFQPLLYQCATGILSEGAVAPPLREVLRKHRNVQVELATVTDFDLQAKTVTAVTPLGAPLTIPYDSLIVAAGAHGSYFGHDEFARFAPGMKTIDDASAITRPKASVVTQNPAGTRIPSIRDISPRCAPLTPATAVCVWSISARPST